MVKPLQAQPVLGLRGAIRLALPCLAAAWLFEEHRLALWWPHPLLLSWHLRPAGDSPASSDFLSTST